MSPVEVLTVVIYRAEASPEFLLVIMIAFIRSKVSNRVRVASIDEVEFTLWRMGKFIYRIFCSLLEYMMVMGNPIPST